MDVGVLGLGREAGAVYRVALRHAPAGRDDIARLLEMDPASVSAQLLLLERVGLVCQEDGWVRALAPRGPLERLAARQAQELDATRSAADALAELWNQRSGRGSFIEVVDNEQDAREIEAAWMDGAGIEVTGLSTGPVGPANGADSGTLPRPNVHSGFFEARDRGVRFRVVYPVAVLRDSLSFDCVRQCLQAGEEARVLPEVPLNVVVFDGKRALISVTGVAGERRMLVAVHESGLLSGIVALFENYWQMAVPIDPDTTVGASHDPRLDPKSRWLLAHLAAGRTDDAIARDLGVSSRTLGRRVRRLEQILGADSRFQLAVQATKRGWI